ncbi:PQQ-binding-like beta-propeller repeat protein, partial [Agriterribacter sp.]|uniref:outer membrane protein assembly factor BamB family protein n=1 Tax=Agriterribacter sp. TaxID=2821509 RepID=UPI002CEB042A
MKCRSFLIPVLIVSLLSCRQQESGWQVSRGNAESNCYSPLDQVNINNVKDLEVAWTYHTGDSGAAIQCNPIVVDGVMYVTSPALKVIALKASDGAMLWTFDPFKEGNPYDVNRGVTYWQRGEDKRILFTAGHNLYALNAQTGQMIPTFGKKGTVDLREGLDRDPDDLFVTVTSPGIVFDDLLILGSRTTEAEGAAPGHVRAFNVLTGKEAWVFHTIPQPGEFGYDTWEKDTWKNVGGANTWSGFSLDEKRGMVFFGTGSCTPDFFGGGRKGQNLFANSVIALNAA